MPRYKPYIPETIGDLHDVLGMMMLKSPTFIDDFFRGKNVETVFFALNEGLKNLQKKLGDERYQNLRAMSDKMRAHFEADPEDKTGEATEGRAIILDMIDILKAMRRK